MAALIDTSYFYGERTIAQVDTAPVAALVTKLIDEHEPKFLEDLLGYETYKALLAVPADQKWVDVIDGKEYTNRNLHLTKWKGLKAVTATAKRSPIADYVYVRYMQTIQSFSTGSGEKNLEPQATVDNASKVVRAWNDMVAENRNLVDFLLSNNAAYPEFALYFDRRGNRALLNLLSNMSHF